MILILKQVGSGGNPEDGLYQIVAEYEDVKICDTDLGSPDFLASRPELENQEVYVVDVLEVKVLVDQRLEKARALLKKGKMSKTDIDFVLGLAEPEDPSEGEAVGVKRPEIPNNWQDAKIGTLRKYAKIACPDEKVGRWTKDACVMAINKYLGEMKSEAQDPDEKHAAALLPIPKPEPAPATQDTTIAPPPPVPPVSTGTPPAVPAPGTAPPVIVPPALLSAGIQVPNTQKNNAIPAPPPPPPLG